MSIIKALFKLPKDLKLIKAGEMTPGMASEIDSFLGKVGAAVKLGGYELSPAQSQYWIKQYKELNKFQDRINTIKSENKAAVEALKKDKPSAEIIEFPKEDFAYGGNVMKPSGIMKVSHMGNDKFLEQRYEYYLELGYAPEEAARKAQEDLSGGNFPQPLAEGGKVEKKESPISGEDFQKIIEDFIKQQQEQERIRKESKAMGGMIGDGTKPSAAENTPSQEIIDRMISQIKDMSKRGADIDTIKSITGASDQMIKDVLGKAMGGRVGFSEGGGMPSPEKIQQMRRILFGLLDNPDILVLPDRDIYEMYLNLDETRKRHADGGSVSDGSSKATKTKASYQVAGKDGKPTGQMVYGAQATRSGQLADKDQRQPLRTGGLSTLFRRK